MGSLPQAIAPNPPTNLLHVYIQNANKTEFKKNYCTANYRSVLSSDRAPYMKKKDVIKQRKLK
jgi:hypothetical protein